MKRVELESFLKGFILFLLSMGTLLTMIIYSTYNKDIKNLDESILNRMRIYNFNLQGDEFKVGFSSKTHIPTYKLYKDKEGLNAYFPIPNSKENLLVVSLSSQKYQKAISQLKWNLLKESIPLIIVIILLSILFSFYTLYPLRHSLRLTEEFIKDILHDFNTPLATLRLNSSMLKREIGENRKINRMEKSIESILSLQENLRCYLFDHELQQSSFDLREIIETSIANIEKNYPLLTYKIDIEKNINLRANETAFRRVIDNLISNASKYNKIKGEVSVSYTKNQLIIADTGKGIKNTHKIFQRFYTEQDRGIGVGLHIVKKLCDELKISIKVTSKIGVGTKIILLLPHKVTN